MPIGFNELFSSPRRLYLCVTDLDILLSRCRRGDRESWEALVYRYQARVYGFALHYLRDHEEARDAAQEIFTKMYQHLNGFRDGQAFLPWMLRLARPSSAGSIARPPTPRPSNPCSSAYVGYYQRGFINVIVVGALIALLTRGLGPLTPLAALFLAFFWLYNIVDAGRRALLYNEALAGRTGIELPGARQAVSSRFP